jgi:hypothetical protein
MLAAAMLTDANARTVQGLPEPIFADTEISTNVAMTAWTQNTRNISVVLSLDATPSNNVMEALENGNSLAFSGLDGFYASQMAFHEILGSAQSHGAGRRSGQ